MAFTRPSKGRSSTFVQAVLSEAGLVRGRSCLKHDVRLFNPGDADRFRGLLLCLGAAADSQLHAGAWTGALGCGMDKIRRSYGPRVSPGMRYRLSQLSVAQERCFRA